ncbi:hypothetical protein ACFX2A_016388 [Malus domestica]
MEAPISRGREALTTAAIRQLNVKAITKAVTVRERFCTIVDRRSARALRTNVAFAAKVDVSDPVLFSSKSNQPTSFERMAAVKNKNAVLSFDGFRNVHYMRNKNMVQSLRSRRTFEH